MFYDNLPETQFTKENINVNLMGILEEYPHEYSNYLRFHIMTNSRYQSLQPADEVHPSLLLLTLLFSVCVVKLALSDVTKIIDTSVR